MEPIRILWIDDYPSPRQLTIASIFKKKFLCDVRLAYLREDGRAEGREWMLSHEGSVCSGEASRALREACDTDRIVFFEPTLASTTLKFLFFNLPSLLRCRWVAIVGHLSTDGIEKIHPKNFLRKILSVFSSWGAKFVWYLSEKSKLYSSVLKYDISRGNNIVIFGSPLLQDSFATTTDLEINGGEEKINILLVGIWNERKRFDVVARALFGIESFCSRCEIHHVGKFPKSAEKKFPFIKFHGYISDRKILKNIRLKSHVSFLLSTREPWGHVFIENIAAGLLTFTSKNCGTNDVNSKIDERLIIRNVTAKSIVSSFKWFSSLGKFDILNLRKFGVEISKKYDMEMVASEVYAKLRILEK